MSTSSGRHSGCSTSRAARRDPPDTWEATYLLPGFRNAADDGTLPNSRAVRARPVIDFVAGMELDRVPRVIAHVSNKIYYGTRTDGAGIGKRSEEHTSELQSRGHLVC